MKKILTSLFILLSSTAFADPHLVSDPDQTGASDLCVYTVDGGAPVETPVVAVPPSTIIGSCYIDMAGITPGNHALELWFKSTLWNVESAKVPFALSKPAAGGNGPAGLRLE